MRSRSIGATVGACLAVFSLTFAVNPTTAGAQTPNPFQRGPDPTNASIEASRGFFTTTQTSVPSSVPGFGGGTIYYPTSTSQGTFGAVAVAPGFTADQTSLSWLGPRLASQGFVIFTINTNSRFDFPSSRATQLMEALEYLVEDSSVRTRIDGTRLGVMGHSMGGGGSLIAARDNSGLQAAVPLAPWNSSTNFSGVRVPTMVVACENDSVASVSSHASPFYNSIPASSEKAFMEIDNGSHSCPNSSNTTIAKYAISWLKRFIDNDTRYEQFLCPPPDDSTISEYRNTCPHI